MLIDRMNSKVLYFIDKNTSKVIKFDFNACNKEPANLPYHLINLNSNLS